MPTQDPLNLQRVQLKPAQEWAHKGEHLSFIFPKAGVGNWIAGAGSQRLVSGDVLVLNAAFGGKILVANSGEMGFWCFSLHMEHLFPLFESSEFCLFQTVSDGFKTARLYPAASATAQECHRRLTQIPAQVNLDHRSHLLRVAAAILTDEFNAAKTGRVGFVQPEDHMIQVFEKLTTAEMMNLSVGELADKFGCSRRHLNRLFHHYFGLSVAALRMEMRLLRATTLLRDSEAKIIRVAEDCGFHQLGLFNICFKRRFGVSPGRWRKQKINCRTGPDHLDPDAIRCLLQIKGLCPLSGTCHADGSAPFAAPSTYKEGSVRLRVSVERSKEEWPGRLASGRKPAKISESTQGRILVPTKD